MATTISGDTAGRSRSGIGVVRLALTGAIAATAFFVLCWAGAFLPIGPATHMYLQLFTSAENSTARALLEGACWSAAFGLVAGALIAVVYNALGPLDRR
jgi:hypothetical protein